MPASIKDPGMGEAQYLREVMIGLSLNVLTFYSVYFTFSRIMTFRNTSNPSRVLIQRIPDLSWQSGVRGGVVDAGDCRLRKAIREGISPEYKLPGISRQIGQEQQ